MNNKNITIQEIFDLIKNNKYQSALRKIDNLLKKEDDINLLINKSSILINLEKFYQAELILTNLLSDEPQNQDILTNLGIIKVKTKKYDEAEKFYKAAQNIDIKNVNVTFNLINLYFEIDDIERALFELIKINFLNLNSEYYHQLLAEAYIRNRVYDQAINEHNNAIRLNPTNPLNYFWRGVCLTWGGKFEAAQESFLKAIELNPENFEFYFSLSRISKIDKGSDLFKKLKLNIDNNLLGNKNLSYLYFTLHKIYENEKNYEKSFEYLSKANRLQKNINKFNLNKLHQLKEKIKFNFSKFFVKELDNDSQIPIFIVGMPRSGTSLLEQIISKHKLVYAAGELNFIHHHLKQSFEYSNIKDNYEIIRQGYLKKLFSLTNKKYIVDKMPFNFFWIGYILKLFPKAKIIHIQRERTDTCFSIFKHVFAEGAVSFAYSQRDIMNFYSVYNELMSFWKDQVGSQYFDLNYEDLAENPLEKSKEVFNFLKIEFKKDYINISENSNWIQTASDVQLRDKISLNKIPKWKYYENYINELKGN